MDRIFQIATKSTNFHTENNNGLEISIEPHEMQDRISAIKSLKNGKSPGNDNLNAELSKIDLDLSFILLYNIFKDI